MTARISRYFFPALLLIKLAAQDTNEALAQKAVEAERAGNFAQAVALFQQLIAKGADSLELRSNLGIAYYQSGDLSNAAKEFKLILAKTPDAPAANLFCGLSLAKLGRPEEGLVYLSRAQRADPNNPQTLEALAQTEVASGQIAKANEHFRRVTVIDSRNAEAWYAIGITDRLLAEAKSRAAKQAADVSVATNDRRQAEELMTDFQNSVAVAMQLDPGSVRANMILGESFRIAERYDEAIREYEAATTHAPNLAPAWAGLAASYSAAGDDAKGLTAAKHAADLDPTDPETNTLLAAIYVRLGDMEKAEPFIRRALAVHPNLSSAHVVLAKIYLSRQQTESAVSELQAAAKDDVDGSTNYLLATTLHRLGRSAEASAAMRKFERLHQLHVARNK